MLVHFDFLQSIFKLLYFIFTVMHNKSQRNPNLQKEVMVFKTQRATATAIEKKNIF